MASVLAIAYSFSVTAQSPTSCPVVKPDTTIVFINQHTGERFNRSMLQSIATEIKSVHVTKDTAYVVFKTPGSIKDIASKAKPSAEPIRIVPAGQSPVQSR